jgi:hypothetical protein
MDLSVTCPHCAERIEPDRQMRLSMDGNYALPGVQAGVHRIVASPHRNSCVNCGVHERVNLERTH